MRRSRINAAFLVTLSLVIAACTSSPKAPTESSPPPPQPGPTGFLTSNLSLPSLEASGGDADISVTVTNTGTIEASHELKLMIDGVVVGTKSVTLAGGVSQVVSFSTVLDHAGTHNVTIDQVTGKLNWAGPN
jgi:hypothetical protein